MRKHPNPLSFAPVAALVIIHLLSGCKKEVSTQELAQYAVQVPNDAQYSSLWGMKKIEMPTAWGIINDCSGVRGAVVDTGVDYTHPDLQANFFHDSTTSLAGKDARSGIASPYDPKDDNFHGTHVMGTMAAQGNNSYGVVGICWKADMVAVKVLDSDGSGTNADVASGIDYAVTSGAKVINMSLGGTSTSAAVDTSISSARTNGVLIVAAAGNSANDNDSIPFYPATYSYDNIISVAATTRSDALASFSNYGKNSVHIAAPGVEILSTFPTNVTTAMTSSGKTSTFESIQGTSMASPHVAGAALLVWAKHPTYTYTQVREYLFNNATKLESLSGKVIGGRRLRLGPIQ